MSEGVGVWLDWIERTVPLPLRSLNPLWACSSSHLTVPTALAGDTSQKHLSPGWTDSKAGAAFLQPWTYTVWDLVLVLQLSSCVTSGQLLTSLSQHLTCKVGIISPCILQSCCDAWKTRRVKHLSTALGMQ